MTYRLLLLAFLVIPAGAWTVQQKAVLTGFNVPECVLVDPATGGCFVSNIETSSKDYWGADGHGFISTLNPGGTLAQRRWVESRPNGVLDAPKGLTLLNGVLCAADITQIRRYDVGQQTALPPFRHQGWQRLNDLANDGTAIYVSDTQAGRVWRLSADGISAVQAPPGINGLTFHDGQMYGVSWTQHEVYELDPTGAKPAVAFGLARHFVSLDGIEVLEDGTFLVTDFPGNKLCSISPDRRSVTTLLELQSPADLGLDRERGLLYVPQFLANQVVVLQLQRGDDA